MSNYLCYQDTNGFRGYIPPHTPYILRQISASQIWIESENITALVDTGSPDEYCEHYKKVIGFVNKEDKALKWITCGDNSQFMGTNNCKE